MSPGRAGTRADLAAQPRRRRARIRPAVPATPLTHLDLENLVVALLAEGRNGWPNALHGIGYRLMLFDAAITLIQIVEGRPQRIPRRPDAVAYHEGKNIALVLECKAGTHEVGFRQIPEGMASIPIDQWAAAMSLPRGGLVPFRAHGVLVAASEFLESKAQVIEDARASWFRVTPGFELRPNNVSDGRVGEVLTELPAPPWPTQFVPFSHDGNESMPRIVASIGPLIIAAAFRGEDHVSAADLARSTHKAVWATTDDERHQNWTDRVNDALINLAHGPMRQIARHEAATKRLRLLGIRQGESPPPRVIFGLKQAIDRVQRRRRAGRVPRARPPADQMTLFEDEF